LGWPRERILVIDEDQGHSAASAQGRLGFQRLVAKVGLGHVGVVLAVEMSRLAHSCCDWHQLLEICALRDTLLGDCQGIYDANALNDHLLLGLKGMISETELHLLKFRMDEGRRANAQRGELAFQLLRGYQRRADGSAAFDPTSRYRQPSAWSSPCLSAWAACGASCTTWSIMGSVFRTGGVARLAKANWSGGARTGRL
jgi:DNA invertase Pin-like site-specific DNA recombinase